MLVDQLFGSVEGNRLSISCSFFVSAKLGWDEPFDTCADGDIDEA